MSIPRLRRNALANVLGWLAPALIFLVLTPIMVDKLGTAGFGVIALIQIITGYMNMLNFGFSEAIIRQVAENLERDRALAMRVMWAGLGLFAVAGLLGMLVLWAVADWLGGSLLQVPAELRADTVSALRLGAVVFFLQMIAEFLRGTAIGANRFDVPNLSRVVRILVSAVLIVYVLQHGGGVVAVMVATLIGLVFGLILNVVWMQHVLPMTPMGGEYAPVFRELFHFSKHIFLVRIVGTVSSKISQFFLGTLSSVANIALYEVPARAAETGSVLLNRILQVFYPSFSSMDRVAEKDRIQAMTFSVLSIQLLVSMPILLLVVLEGPTVLAWWINAEFADAASGIIALVALAYFFSSMTNIPTILAMSFNMPAIVSKYSVMRMVIALAIVYPLVERFALVGAAWVLMLSELVALPFMYAAVKRVLGVNPYTALLRQLLVHGAIFLSLGGMYELVYRGSAWYSPLAVLGVSIGYVLLAVSLRATSSEDNRRILRLVTIWR